jgi:hypothetical protein
MTTAVAAPPALVGTARHARAWLMLSIERNHGRPVYVSAVRLADVFDVSLRTAERVAETLHQRGGLVYERPRWNPDSLYESVHHMPGRYSLPA